MNNKTIAILMATFNGGKYVGEQLHSILTQTTVNWHLYAHDDGSTDDTTAILQSYAARYPQRITLLNYPPEGGVFQNFMSMLEKTDADYYMFCDQDDIWHPDKIEKSMAIINCQENKLGSIPIVIHTDLKVVDERGNTIAPSLWQQAGMHPEMFKTFGQRITNVLSGCTMLFNKPARNAALSKKPYGHPLHDEWVAIRACAEGGCITPVFEPLIDYRQHSANASGAEACYNKKDMVYYLTSIKKIYQENRNNYLVLKSAGYGSLLTYIFNKIRNIFVYHFMYR